MNAFCATLSCACSATWATGRNSANAPIAAKQLQPEVNYFSPAQGGALCRECGYPDMGAKTLSVNALKVLRLWLACDFDTARRVKLNSELTREIKNIMRENIKYVLEKQLKSIEWMDKLAGESNINGNTPCATAGRCKIPPKASALSCPGSRL